MEQCLPICKMSLNEIEVIRVICRYSGADEMCFFICEESKANM